MSDSASAVPYGASGSGAAGSAAPGTRRGARRRAARRGARDRGRVHCSHRRQGGPRPAPDRDERGAHRARHRHRTDAQAGRGHVLLRSQLGLDLRRGAAAAAVARPPPSSRWSTRTCGNGSGGRRGSRSTGTSTRPRRWCSPRWPRTPCSSCSGACRRSRATRSACSGSLRPSRSTSLVNTLLVARRHRAVGPRPQQWPEPALQRLMGRWDDNVLELATLCMGALAAVALADSPGLAVLALPPILVLHRAVLVRQLEDRGQHGRQDRPLQRRRRGRARPAAPCAAASATAPPSAC